MELFQSLLPLIVTLLLFAINHYYVKDLKKMAKISLFYVMLPLMAIFVLLTEFGFLP